MKRITAAALALTLIVLSPGLPAYQAFAAEIGNGSGPKTPGGVTGPVSANVPKIETLSLPASPVPGAINTETALQAPGGIVGGSLEAPQSGVGNVAQAHGPVALPAHAVPGDMGLPKVMLSAELQADVDASQRASAQKQAEADLPEIPITDADIISERTATLPSGDPNAITQKIPRKVLEEARALSAAKEPKKSWLSGWFFDRSKKASDAAPVQAAPAASAAAKPGQTDPNEITQEIPRAVLEAALAKSRERDPEDAAKAALKAAAVPAPAKAKKAPLLARLKEKFTLKGYTASEKSYIGGQMVFLAAISIYIASLPLLVKAITGSAAHAGTARLFHFWALAAGSLFAGKLVKKLGMMKVLRGGSTIRAIAFGAIGVLSLAGLMPWPVFVGLVTLNALVVAHTTLVDLDEGGAAMVMNSDEKIEKSGYLYDTLFNAAMLVVPPLVGLAIDVLDTRFGEGIGPKIAYIAFSAVMLLAVRMYGKVRVLREESTKELLGHVETVKLIFRNAAIRTRWMLTTMENFIEDALFSVVLPVYALDILHQGGFGSGLLLSGKMVGGLMAGAAMSRWAIPAQKRVGPYKFLVGLTILASVAFVPTIGLWLFPSMIFAVPVAMLMKLAYQPIRSRMRALLQVAIKNDPIAKDHPTEVFSLMNFTGLIAAGAGGLVFELLFEAAKPGHLLFDVLGAMAPMKILTGFLAMMSAFYVVGLRWMKKEMTRITRTVHPGRGTMTQAFEAGSLESVQKGLLKFLDKADVRLAALKHYQAAEDLIFKQDKAAVAVLASLQSEVEKFAPQWADEIEAAKVYASAGHFEEAFPVLAEFGGSLSPLEEAALDVESAIVQRDAGDPKLAVKTLGTIKAKLPQLEEAIALSRLAQSLARMGLEPAKEELVSEAVSDDRPTSVILSPASVYKLSIAQEGGRQSPRDVHLALDPSWLIHEVGPDGKGKLFLTKGVTFDADGQARVVTYAKPRKVRYFANFYTLGGNGRDDGNVLEKELDVPQSNSLQLEKVTNDKLLTRLMLAAKGVAVPATVAFLMAGHPLKASAAALDASGSGVHAAVMPESRDEIKSRIGEFLKHYQGEEVVVKPSGPEFHSSEGVKFFDRGDLDGMADHVIALSKHPGMTQEGAVLVDERLAPPSIHLRVHDSGPGSTVGFVGDAIPVRVLEKGELASADPAEKKDWNIRVLAARTPWGDGVSSGFFVRAGRWGIPTVGEPKDPKDAAAIISLDETIKALQKQHGLLKTQAEVDAFRDSLNEVGAKALEAIAAKEKERARESGEPYQAQTDFIGLDVMVVLENGRLVPKIIEVNDHDAGGQWQMDTFHPERAGEHSRAWVATMLARARRDALKGKRIALIGGGPAGKKHFIERANRLGIEVVLVDKGVPAWKRLGGKVLQLFGAKPVADHWARGLVSEFIDVDLNQGDPAKLEEAIASARKKLQRSIRKNGKLDGITTYWEDDVVTTARLAQDLGLAYHSVESSQIARNKFETRRAMAAAGMKTPANALIKTRSDLEKLKGFPFPAVLKPARGAEALLTVRVDNLKQALEQYDIIAKKVNVGTDAVYKEGSEIILDEYLAGREWDADIVVQGGKVVYASVTDNWPTREPYFVATGSSLPSRALTKAEQAEVVAFAVQSIAALGLKDGVFHMEGKYQAGEGSRLIEANARPGGSYVVPWNLAVNGVDLGEMLFATAAGVPVSSYKAETPRVYLEGEFIMPERSGTLKEMRLPEELQSAPGLHEFVANKAVGSRLEVPYKARAGLITARGSSSRAAQNELAELKKHLVVDIDYDREPAPSPSGK